MDTFLTVLKQAPAGYKHYGSSGMFAVYLAYLIKYRIRSQETLLENGELKPEVEELLWSVKEENRPLLNEYVDGPPRASWAKRDDGKQTAQVRPICTTLQDNSASATTPKTREFHTSARAMQGLQAGYNIRPHSWQRSPSSLLLSRRLSVAANGLRKLLL
ncbi:hypothetical protein EVG20_g1900 [Dentipellis fragilis]|uniref:Uncharacterized protein n=1 Tax=Dentipellis fragilis TaxID=205917 RepID=A0A4Y9Z986_9AGAM|nr:hypothetical protein EVG20_g1900 [Dentipellis fragilis]